MALEGKQLEKLREKASYTTNMQEGSDNLLSYLLLSS